MGAWAGGDPRSCRRSAHRSRCNWTMRGDCLAGLVFGRRRAAHGRPRSARHQGSARTSTPPVITARTTRLVRAADLRSFRNALAALATGGSPFDARDRLIVVPTRAASLHFLRSMEDRMTGPTALVLPDLVTRAELHVRLFERIDPALGPAAPYTDAEREALLSVACRAAIAAGTAPPFRVRPGLIAEMLEFFDSLKRHQKTVDDFERLTMGRLEGAETDRGAERLIRQTRFFVAAFREFERRCSES